MNKSLTMKTSETTLEPGRFSPAEIAYLEQLRADYDANWHGELLEEGERRRARFARWLYASGRWQS